MADDQAAVIERLTRLVEQQSVQLQQQAQVIQQVMSDRNVNNNGGGSNSVNAPGVEKTSEERDKEQATERFRRLKPPIFEDAKDPIEAENWVQTVERMFEYAHIPESEKVNCATFMLRGSAGFWWDTIRRAGEANEIAWTDFRTRFRAKYFSDAVQNEKLDEFIRLQQGDRSVHEYSKKFDELARFAVHMVDTPARKVARFIVGLKPILARDVQLTSTATTSYTEVIERAYLAERAEARIAQASRVVDKSVQRAQPAQRQTFSSQSSSLSNRERNVYEKDQGGSNKRPLGNESSSQPSPKRGTGPLSFPTCPTCGKKHEGRCYYGTGRCYACGKEGHMSYHCPERENQTSKPQLTGQVFALTHSEAADDISGIVFFSSLLLCGTGM